MNSRRTNIEPTRDDIICLQAIVGDDKYLNTLSRMDLSITRVIDVVEDSHIAEVLWAEHRLEKAKVQFRHEKNVKLAAVYKRMIIVQRNEDAEGIQECNATLAYLATVNKNMAIITLENHLLTLTTHVAKAS